jgi:hypothetical protein
MQRHALGTKPLGNPPPNGIKFFAAADVLELIKDRYWLAKVTNTVNQHWRKQNARRKRHVLGDRGDSRSATSIVSAAAAS